MPTVNQYFQSGKSIGVASEQNLYQDLIIESMKIYGFEVYYLPRKAAGYDDILTENTGNYYENAYPIEMYMQNVMGFEGEGELLTKFGLEIRDTATFIVARRRWNSIVRDTGTTVLPRPAEGDVIYLPITKSYFEIRKVDGQDPFFQVGKLYIYKMSCELMQFSSEVFDTGITEIDSITANISLTIDNFEFLLETGNALIQESGAVTPVVLEDYENENEELDIDNQTYDINVENVLDFSERNPFGEPYR